MSHDNAYQVARAALRDTLKAGVVASNDLEDVQHAMKKLEPVAEGFGLAHYRELRTLLDLVEKLPVRVVAQPMRTTDRQFVAIVGIAVAVFFGVKFAVAEPLTVTGPSRVIDGDTVVVGTTHVRLKGVDTADGADINRAPSCAPMSARRARWAGRDPMSLLELSAMTN